jgi:outer membrane receptor protein involved in Fe transport
MLPGRVVVAVCLLAFAGAAQAQQRDTSKERRVTLSVRERTLGDVLREVAAQSGARLVYSDDVVPVERRVTVEVREATVSEAMSVVLAGTGVSARRGSGGVVVLERAAPPPASAARRAGAIAGRVTDAESGEGVAGATITLEGTARRAISGESGRFLLAQVQPGEWRVGVRRIGYVPGSVQVVVTEGAEASADVALKRTVGTLEDVVVTGAIAETERKALPTPITVVTAEDLRKHHVQRVDQLFRGRVPGSISWEQGTDDYVNSITVRGASSLITGQNTIKTYVDGVEVSNNLFSIVDVSTIDRIEIIRGPQGSTLYGSDAAGGVMQIFTKKGSFGDARPRVELEAAGTAIESPYDDGRTLEQRYAASVHGGTQDVSYRIGGTFRRTGEWVSDYELVAPSVHAAARLVQRALTLELSARYTKRTNGDPWNPVLRDKGWAPFATAPNREQEIQNQTYGVSVLYAATDRWEHRVSAGFDRVQQDFYNTKPRVEDGLFLVQQNQQDKVSVGYNTSLRVGAQPFSAVLTGGVEHYELKSNGYRASGALNNIGSLISAPNQPPIPFRGTGSNSGYFAQGQLALHDAVFLTVGVRAEHNSNFGNDYGTAVAPRVGVSAVRRLGSVVGKVRASYGRGIRPPPSGINIDAPGVRANTELAPEEQRGGDIGLDVEIGTGAMLSGTYYNQRAIGLIDAVLVDPTTSPPTFQYQNAGRIRNEGVEMEGRVQFGAFEAQGQYSITDSKVLALSPTYGGDLQVGDELLVIPRRSGGASLSYTAASRTTLTASVVHMGEWTNTDIIALLGFAFGGEPFRGSLRAYWMRYPAVTKLNVGVEHRFSRVLASFVSVENLTNNERFEFSNATMIPGRRITIGARFTPEP